MVVLCPKICPFQSIGQCKIIFKSDYINMSFLQFHWKCSVFCLPNPFLPPFGLIYTPASYLNFL